MNLIIYFLLFYVLDAAVLNMALSGLTNDAVTFSWTNYFYCMAGLTILKRTLK